MLYNPNIHHRRSLRLQDYDYSQTGVYFVTICTHLREKLFGEIHNEYMHLNQIGMITQTCWRAIPDHFPHVETDEFIVMPNHIHGILVFTAFSDVSPSRQFSKPISGSLSVVIASFKSSVTRKIKQFNANFATPVWQKNYHEHIIRDEISLSTIRNYVINNPSTWGKDTFYCDDR
ncbi:MAG: transposase [bacterium]|nr:transposase [bacterium]